MSLPMPHADKPEEVGLSSQRLWRLTDALKRDVDKGAAPGAVVLIARRGKVACHEAIGFRDREAGQAMTADTLFRIYSMTKPFTSVAAMMLSEEGALSIADPDRVEASNLHGATSAGTAVLPKRSDSPKGTRTQVYRGYPRFIPWLCLRDAQGRSARSG